jgi:hypothetical protein
MKKSDIKCELLLEYFVTKELWRAYRRRGGDVGPFGKVMDNYMDLLDIYELMDFGFGNHGIMTLLNMEQGAYDRLLRKYKAYKIYKKK